MSSFFKKIACEMFFNFRNNVIFVFHAYALYICLYVQYYINQIQTYKSFYN